MAGELRCPECGQTYDADVPMCPNDGWSLVPVTASSAADRGEAASAGPASSMWSGPGASGAGDPADARATVVLPEAVHAADPAGKVEIIVNSSVFDLNEGDRVVLGRSDDLPSANAFSINSNISRIHAQIALTNGEVIVTDLGSTNGTFVSGTRLVQGSPHILAPSAPLRLAANVPVTVRWPQEDRS